MSHPELEKLRKEMAQDFGKVLDSMDDEEGKNFKKELFDSIKASMKDEGVEFTLENLNAMIVGIRLHNNYNTHQGERMAKLLSLSLITMYEEMKV